MLFIDGTNLDHRLRAAFNRDDIDFTKFFAALAQGTTLIHTHYFSAPYVRAGNQARYAKQTADFNYLRTLPNVTLCLGRHQPRVVTCRSCNHQYTSYAEKGTDIYTAAKLVHAACHKLADLLILVTGDNDFWPSVRIARDDGATVHVAFVISPGEPLHDQLTRLTQLRQYAHRYIKLDQAFVANCWR